MSKVYSTAELIKILEEERPACLHGRRPNLLDTRATRNRPRGRSRTSDAAPLTSSLDGARQACLRGRRLNLTETPATGNPVIDRFLKSEGVQKFTAYQNFKAAVHEYQREHQVSGIVWREIAVKGNTLRYPAVDDELIALPVDLITLKAAKISMLEFWQQVTAGMDLYLSINSGKDFRSIEPVDVEAIAQRTEWASLSNWEKD